MNFRSGDRFPEGERKGEGNGSDHLADRFVVVGRYVCWLLDHWRINSLNAFGGYPLQYGIGSFERGDVGLGRYFSSQRQITHFTARHRALNSTIEFDNKLSVTLCAGHHRLNNIAVIKFPNLFANRKFKLLNVRVNLIQRRLLPPRVPNFMRAWTM